MKINKIHTYTLDLDISLSEIESLYEKCMAESRQAGLDPIKTYIKVGNALLNVLEVDDEIGYMSEAMAKFYNLGKFVMHLTVTYHDLGIAAEEPCWLGYLTYADVAQGNGWATRLKTSGMIEKLPLVEQCTKVELGTLYANYLCGKVDYIQKKYDYQYQ